MTPKILTPRILIIAGSDSGGGAGIQADIKTVTMLGGHAMTAITAITAQNTLGVQAVHPVPTEMVLAQIESCLTDIGVDAVKIGMLGSAETANAVAEYFEKHSANPSPSGEGQGWGLSAGRSAGGEPPPPTLPLKGRGFPIVFDPVMVATSGDTLADEATVAAFERLMRLATVVTPNPDELAQLSASEDRSDLGVTHAASALSERYRTSVLATGTLVSGGRIYGTDRFGRAFDHSTDGRLFDRLFGYDPMNGTHAIDWDGEIISSNSTHGTGCTLASAIATYLAQGVALPDAVARARQFVRLAIHDAPGLGHGHGPMGHQRVRLDLGPGVRLNQVTVPMAAGSEGFYRTLGLTQIVDTEDGHYARFEAANGATLSTESDAAPTIFFECDDLDAEVARLQAAGIVFDHLPVAQEWLWREARLRDPAGNAICLYQAGENRRFPPWRLQQ